MKSESNTYIAELPDYKLPNFKYVCKDVFDKITSFIKKAGSIILLCSVIIWFLLSFSFELEYGVSLENSILANIGNKISWIFYPILGQNSWEATVSILQGLFAKEQVVSSMAVISGFSEEVYKIGIFETDKFKFFTPASAYAFIVFNLFSAPCFGAIAAMRKELGSTKLMLIAIAFQTIIAWIIATLIYQFGSRFENNFVSVADTLIIGFIMCVIFKIIGRKGKNKSCNSCLHCGHCDKI